MFLMSVVMMRVEVNGENTTYFGMNEISVEKKIPTNWWKKYCCTFSRMIYME
jgi:hypothetical protein